MADGERRRHVDGGGQDQQGEAGPPLGSEPMRTHAMHASSPPAHARPCMRVSMQASPGAGFGLFVSESATPKQLRACSLSACRRWWLPFGGAGDSSKQQSVASFPLDLAITAANILRDPQVR